MKLIRLSAYLSLCLLLSGCLYGQCIDGPCSLERARILKSIKPYGQHWSKPGGTLQQRREDSWTCGAARTEHGADHVVFTSEQERVEKHTEEKDEFVARTRLSKAWVNCMKEKGYKYTP